MAKGRQAILAREGWAHIAVTGLAALAVNAYAGWLWASPLWLALAFVLQFFRDPPRRIPAAPLGVLCPADGRVIAVGEAHDPYLDRPAKRVSVFMNAFNAHVNRSPTEGKVMERWYQAGRFFNASLDKASDENERNALWIRTDEGDDIVVVQIAGLLARRILCDKQPGERIAQGERYGFIRFGSRVDTYVPPSSHIKVALGDRVKAGNDIIAHLVRAA